MVPVRAGAIVAQSRRPAAHIERDVLVETGEIPKVLQNVLEPPRRPWEELIGRLVLGQVFAKDGDPVRIQRKLALFVSFPDVPVAHVEDGALDRA